MYPAAEEVEKEGGMRSDAMAADGKIKRGDFQSEVMSGEFETWRNERGDRMGGQTIFFFFFFFFGVDCSSCSYKWVDIFQISYSYNNKKEFQLRFRILIFGSIL